MALMKPQTIVHLPGNTGPGFLNRSMCLLRVIVATLALMSAADTWAVIASGPFANPATGHLYYILEPSSWLSAEAEAVSLGGHLVTIDDTAECEAVTNLAHSTIVCGSFWTGLSNFMCKDRFVWSSGATADFRN